jgi:hypothetical protein
MVRNRKMYCFLKKEFRKNLKIPMPEIISIHKIIFIHILYTNAFTLSENVHITGDAPVYVFRTEKAINSARTFLVVTCTGLLCLMNYISQGQTKGRQNTSISANNVELH